MVEDEQSPEGVGADRVASDDGVEHEEIRVPYAVEDRDGIVNVANGRRQELALQEGVILEASLEDAAMYLGDLGCPFAGLEERDGFLLRRGERGQCCPVKAYGPKI